jgi:NAD(P)-dependent dehydrogenase (short-subunit alcohol dehydrogenase family)
MRLAHKVAIITGAARGMGEVEARLFAAEGASVLVVDLVDDEGEAVVQSIIDAGGSAAYAHADVTDRDDWNDILHLASTRFAPVDILVNNAGIAAGAVGTSDPLEAWNRLIAVNTTSAFLGTTLAAEQMKGRGGAIVNISSIAAYAGGESHLGYYASKAAILGLTKGAAVQFGPAGIRVNAVCPGYMPPMRGTSNFALREAKIPLIPLGRSGQPTDVAHGVLYLASDESSFVNGTELVIDGGYLAQ